MKKTSGNITSLLSGIGEQTQEAELRTKCYPKLIPNVKLLHIAAATLP